MIINKLRYLYPTCPINNSPGNRIKLGLMNYANLHSCWAPPILQDIIKRKRFKFSLPRDHALCELEFIVSGSDISHIWVCKELFIDNVYDLSLVPFEPTTIIDLGANIGLFAIISKKKWSNSKLVCVEPSEITFNFLCLNLSNNKVQASKIQAAVGGKLDFIEMSGDEAVARHVKSSRTSESIISLPLGAFVEMGSDESLLLKIDIEGSEIAALSKISNKFPPNTFIFIELHHGDESIRFITNWAEENKFIFVSTRRRDDAIDGYLRRKCYN